MPQKLLDLKLSFITLNGVEIYVEYDDRCYHDYLHQQKAAVLPGPEEGQVEMPPDGDNNSATINKPVPDLVFMFNAGIW